ncbi:MAG: hypothetical protein JRI61_03600 [Deltaproteobacteria bacterium]|nr:hypothetical protein [Deltaproteobacteria bacterium]
MRPSIRELNNKIQISKKIVSVGTILIINSEVIAEDAAELGYLIAELKEVLLQIFEEIKPNHYVGKRPPQRSYETKIKNMELFAFKWKSRKFGCNTYIKFALKNNVFYLVSLHENR